MRRIFSLMVVSLVFVAACDNDRLRSICESNPELCQDLNSDGYCRLERSNLIRSRFDRQNNPGDESTYRLMTSLEDYLQCIEKTTLMEYTERKERKNNRVEGMLAAQGQLDQLREETRTNAGPHMLIWHWTHDGDSQAKAKFLQLEGTQVLETPELQLALSSFYRQSDPEATIRILQHALSLYRADDEINLLIPSSLTRAYMMKRDYPAAYLWGRVTEGLEGPGMVDKNNFPAFRQIGEQQQEDLDDEAETIVKQLKKGRYQDAGH